jgi:hypothetical protein
VGIGVAAIAAIAARRTCPAFSAITTAGAVTAVKGERVVTRVTAITTADTRPAGKTGLATRREVVR